MSNRNKNKIIIFIRSEKYVIAYLVKNISPTLILLWPIYNNIWFIFCRRFNSRENIYRMPRQDLLFLFLILYLYNIIILYYFYMTTRRVVLVGIFFLYFKSRQIKTIVGCLFVQIYIETLLQYQFNNTII